MKKMLYSREIILFSFFLFVCPSLGVRIYPAISEKISKTGSRLTLNCTDSDEPVEWTFPKESLNNTKKIENGTLHGIYYSNLTISSTQYLDTGYFICRSPNNASNVAQIYIYGFDKDYPWAKSPTVVDAAMRSTAVIPCKTTSPDINVTITTTTENLVELVEKYDSKIGYVISTRSIVDSASFNCYAPEYGKELRIKVNVHPPQNGSSSTPDLKTFDSNFMYHPHPIFENRNVTMNCSVITSIFTGIRSMEWEFPKNVEKKMIIGNITEVRNDKFKFMSFFRSLRIRNVTKEDQGNFTCKVVDGNSRTKLSTYSLQVEAWESVFLSVVSENSRTVTVKAGKNTSVEFVGNIESFPQPTTRIWYDPEGKIIYNLSGDQQRKIINEERKTKLIINSVKLENFGKYQLKVDNSLITKTLNFTLIVEEKPVIMNYSKSFSSESLLDPNVTSILQYIITGYPRPKIQCTAMYCNYYSICNKYSFRFLGNRQKYLGEYKLRSTISIELDGIMRIECVASNTLGSDANSSLLLPTDYGIEFGILENYTQPLTVGDDIKLACIASKYQYADNFTWYFEENKIIPSEGIQIKNSTAKFSYLSTLSILNIQKNQSGTYFCKVSYKDRASISEDKNCSLNVQDLRSPSIVYSSMNGESWHVHFHSSIKFMMEVDGFPEPTVVWYKDGKPLSFDDRISTYFFNGKGQILSIKYVSLEDGGVYSFIATNKGGKVRDESHMYVL